MADTGVGTSTRGKTGSGENVGGVSSEIGTDVGGGNDGEGGREAGEQRNTTNNRRGSAAGARTGKDVSKRGIARRVYRVFCVGVERCKCKCRIRARSGGGSVRPMVRLPRTILCGMTQHCGSNTGCQDVA